MLPPTQHPNGTIYRWEIPLGDKLPIINPVEAGLIDVDFRVGNVNYQSDTEVTEVTGPHRGPKTVVAPHNSLSDSPCNTNISGLKKIVPSENDIKLIIERTLPNRSQKRHRQIFELCRELKAYECFEDAEPEAVRHIFRQWHKLALPLMEQKSFIANWASFQESWLATKHAKGQEPVTILFNESVQMDPPKCAEPFKDEPKVVCLVAFCRELQRAAGKRPFFLATRTAGNLLNISPDTARLWLKSLVDEKVLKCESIGSYKTKKASEFRYLGD